MKRLALAVFPGLFLSLAAFAATPSNASLKGTYAFQMSKVQEVSWWKTVSATCFGVKYTVTLGGQTASTKVTEGTGTFNGTGSFSISATNYGEFDQTDSANTVSISCTGNPKQPYTTNSGYPVFFPSSNQTVTGTYSVTSAGTGTMIFANSTPEEDMDFSLGQLNSTGVASVVLMRQVRKNNGEASTGIAVLK